MKAVGLLKLPFCMKNKSKYFLTIYQIAFMFEKIYNRRAVLELSSSFFSVIGLSVSFWTAFSYSEKCKNKQGTKIRDHLEKLVGGGRA